MSIDYYNYLRKTYDMAGHPSTPRPIVPYRDKLLSHTEFYIIEYEDYIIKTKYLYNKRIYNTYAYRMGLRNDFKIVNRNNKINSICYD